MTGRLGGWTYSFVVSLQCADLNQEEGGCSYPSIVLSPLPVVAGPATTNSHCLASSSAVSPQVRARSGGPKGTEPALEVAAVLGRDVEVVIEDDGILEDLKYRLRPRESDADRRAREQAEHAARAYEFELLKEDLAP